MLQRQQSSGRLPVGRQAAASCFATRVAQCERLLKETWPERALGSFHSVALAATRVLESDAATRLVSQQRGVPLAVADSGGQHARSLSWAAH